MATPGGNPVLRALDEAKTQPYHFKAIVIAGMGFFTDSYDLFVISSVSKLLGRIYYYDNTIGKPGALPVNVNAVLPGVAILGSLVGQLFFGWAGDRFGRKKVYGITLALMVIASLGQGLSIGQSSTAVIATLCFFRFWLGFGIGGDYPLSATIMAEYANKKTRGAFVAAVFAMQGMGILTAAAVAIIISAIFNSAYPRHSFRTYTNTSSMRDPSTPPEADWVWRLVLMFGAIPAALTFYSRSQMPETARYTALIERDQKQAAIDMGKVLHTQFDVVEVEKPAQTQSTAYGLFSHEFSRRHGLALVGTCLTWFLLDISYYSQNLFQSQIYTAAGWLPAASSMSGLRETFLVSRANALVALFSVVPGYWFTVAFIDKIGRKPIQLMGFAMMSIFMYILALDFFNLRGQGNPDARTGMYFGGNHMAFIILYALTFFFANFGPNTTTFIIPAELFPARLRSTCHGISAAAGKAGAAVGTFGFLYASLDAKGTQGPKGIVVGPKGIGYKYSLLMLAICSTLGFVVTLICIPETKGLSLEDLSGENEDAYGVTDGELDKKLDTVAEA